VRGVLDTRGVGAADGAPLGGSADGEPPGDGTGDLRARVLRGSDGDLDARRVLLEAGDGPGVTRRRDDGRIPDLLSLESAPDEAAAGA